MNCEQSQFKDQSSSSSCTHLLEKPSKKNTPFRWLFTPFRWLFTPFQFSWFLQKFDQTLSDWCCIEARAGKPTQKRSQIKRLKARELGIEKVINHFQHIFWFEKTTHVRIWEVAGYRGDINWTCSFQKHSKAQNLQILEIIKKRSETIIIAVDLKRQLFLEQQEFYILWITQVFEHQV